ncbi:DUF1643 domain-containing protein [Aquimarina algiphila]|uniref:DUF1643 domain-containing protein n=1 Tax=Aquimarina algiphila TaxID=2047982 RepID=A0A554VJA4_9FLAO|nr:DUF1643 domain-containing protein [Aquimarina algiphila]TSE07926.1 DUF1643 domain-containing protein [Aquimarina algiphila]
MQENFHITGFFYEKEGFKFREFLNIKHLSCTKTNPDLMVIMMNPGSSKPLDGIDNNNKISEAKPDNTQDQIMRIMLHFGYEYSRILNLSDLRESKSKKFYLKVIELEKKKIDHSIFDKSRAKDFENLFVYGVPVLYAWGVSYKLRKLALKAIEKSGNTPSHGWRKEGTEWGYYHPLPPDRNKQKKWIAKITEAINTDKKYPEKTTI